MKLRKNICPHDISAMFKTGLRETKKLGHYHVNSKKNWFALEKTLFQSSFNVVRILFHMISSLSLKMGPVY